MSDLTDEQIEAVKTLQSWANYLAAQSNVTGVSDKVKWQIRNAVTITSMLIREQNCSL